MCGIITLHGLLCCLCMLTCHGKITSGNLVPVILVPGHGGSQIEMNIQRMESIRPGCPVTTDGFVRAWLNLWDFLPGHAECWIEHNKMSYDDLSQTYHDMPGVEHRIPGWGGLDAVEYLDPSYAAFLLGNVGAYFAPLIRKLESWGYKRDINLRGAPYDFRYSPHSVPNFYEPLRELVEEAYTQNRNSKVTLMSHSMGGLMTYYFLDRQTVEWKEKYIHSMITMNTPWHGVVSGIEAMVSGYTWGKPGLNANLFRIMQQSCESGVFNLASPTEWGHNEVVVETEYRNYTSAEYSQLFEDMGYTTGRLMWEDALKDFLDLKRPEVDTWCFYSSGEPTPERLVYESGSFPDGPPRRVMGDGDGTSNIRSARACKAWEHSTKHQVVTQEFKNTTHNGIMVNQEMHKILRDILTI